jgi:hypothetical protein
MAEPGDSNPRIPGVLNFLRREFLQRESLLEKRSARI